MLRILVASGVGVAAAVSKTEACDMVLDDPRFQTFVMTNAVRCTNDLHAADQRCMLIPCMNAFVREVLPQCVDDARCQATCATYSCSAYAAYCGQIKVASSPSMLLGSPLPSFAWNATAAPAKDTALRGDSGDGFVGPFAPPTSEAERSPVSFDLLMAFSLCALAAVGRAWALLRRGRPACDHEPLLAC
mmetsp:Transcript_59329/g.132362  ORF Transcript_59329/g.132362 Transcript_59329/m.132362 type:complete len:189 (+) Transcript_59329:40-606(+)